MTSLRGSQPAFSAHSSQNGQPVSGLKCHCINSRTHASSVARALSSSGTATGISSELYDRAGRGVSPFSGRSVVTSHQDAVDDVNHAVRSQISGGRTQPTVLATSWLPSRGPNTECDIFFFFFFFFFFLKKKLLTNNHRAARAGRGAWRFFFFLIFCYLGSPGIVGVCGGGSRRGGARRPHTDPGAATCHRHQRHRHRRPPTPTTPPAPALRGCFGVPSSGLDWQPGFSPNPAVGANDRRHRDGCYVTCTMSPHSIAPVRDDGIIFERGFWFRVAPSTPPPVSVVFPGNEPPADQFPLRLHGTILPLVVRQHQRPLIAAGNARPASPDIYPGVRPPPQLS